MKHALLPIAGWLLVVTATPCAAGELVPQTALERSGYRQLTRSREVREFLHQLDHLSPEAAVKVLGQSAGGRPLEALTISRGRHAAAASGSGTRLRILLVATQHGTEPSGGEALLSIARALVRGRLRGLLDDTEFIIVPNANPDGRDLRRRVNAAGVNLSTDFLLLSQPESRVLRDLLIRERPEVVLDVHESAILKKRSLGSQGYLTDFEAQFEIANNPNVDGAIRDLSRTRLLPEVIALTSRRGLRAQRYIGEITSLEQPISNGGLSFRNLRNTAGLHGAFSFLLENRLDPPGPEYPTFRNIRARIAKQVVSIDSFLTVITRHAPEILRLTREARARSPSRAVVLQVAYRLDPSHPRVGIPLRDRAGGRIEERWFRDHRAVVACAAIPQPRAYVVKGYGDRLLPLLHRHGMRYRRFRGGLRITATAQRLPARLPDGACTGPVPSERRVAIEVGPRDLWIDADPRLGALLPVLLDPRSTSSVWTWPDYAALIRPGREHFVYRIDSGSGRCSRGAC